jgi:hypothetical protein
MPACTGPTGIRLACLTLFQEIVMSSNTTNASKRSARSTNTGRAAGTESGRSKGETDAQRGMGAPVQKKDGARRRPAQAKRSG